MIDLSAMITDPDFCTSFKILRREGTWNSNGVFATESSEIDVIGIVRPASGSDEQMLPEGDEKRVTLNFLTLEQTYLADSNHLADIFIYQGNRFKAVSQRDWEMHGFYKTTAQMIGDDEDVD